MDWLIRYSDSVITNEMIFDFFKYSEISNSLDGFEDGQFRGCEGLEKIRLLILKMMRRYI